MDYSILIRKFKEDPELGHIYTEAYFNLDDSFEVTNIFARDLNPERIINELSAKSGQTILKGDTLVIFDKIQACERALTSLKYFYENAPEYHIIAAGSLLGVAVNREKYSFPVGKVNMITLYPFLPTLSWLICLASKGLRVHWPKTM